MCPRSSLSCFALPVRHVRLLRWVTVRLLLIVAATVAGLCAAGASQAANRAPRPAGPAGASLWQTLQGTSGFLPIMGQPVEDVDPVEVDTLPGSLLPKTVVWPTEGFVHFIAEGPGAPYVYASFLTAGRHISGVDFVCRGSIGAFATDGYLYVFDMRIPANTFTIPLDYLYPDLLVPARRDIDPLILPGLKAVVYPDGNTVYCVNAETGTLRWVRTLPSLVVEAVDPVVNASETVLFVPSEGWMTAINPQDGTVLAQTNLETRLMREVDPVLASNDTHCYLPADGWLFDFNAGGGLAGAIEISPLIEGCDLQIDPSGTWGMLPTLEAMYQLNLATATVVASYPFAGERLQRNQDVVFAPPCLPFWPIMGAVYAVEGHTYIYNLTNGVGHRVAETFGTLVDGVDPVVTVGQEPGSHQPWPVALVPVLGGLNIVHLVHGSVTGIEGVPLDTDVDLRPGPPPGNRLLVPTTTGLVYVDGFAPDEWVLVGSGGLAVIDVRAETWSWGVSMYQAIFRGGDALPTTLLGPATPNYTPDDPDEDFVARCWDYKWAVNRWPAWWTMSGPEDIDWTWVPFGVFGPPALAGYDIATGASVVVTDGGFNVLSPSGATTEEFWTPAAPLGGLVWDRPNRHVVLRLQDQTSVIYDFNAPASGFQVRADDRPMRAFPIEIPTDIIQMNLTGIYNPEVVFPRGGRTAIIRDRFTAEPIDSVEFPATITRFPEQAEQGGSVDQLTDLMYLPLANGKLAYLDLHKMAQGLPKAQWFFLSDQLPGQIVGQPRADQFGYIVVRTRDSTVVKPPPGGGPPGPPIDYWNPTSDVQIDCCMRLACCFCKQGDTYYEHSWDLYPMTFGRSVETHSYPLPAAPHGYPLFDSKHGLVLYRVGDDGIVWRNPQSRFIPYPQLISTPAPILGNLFMDRVNGYALCRLAGGQLFKIDLYRLAAGLPYASGAITLPVPAEDDIAFDVQHRVAAIHLQGGQVSLMHYQGATVDPPLPGLPPVARQLYAHPFRNTFSYASTDGYVVTIDRGTAHVDPTVAVEGMDFTPPPALDISRVHEADYRAGDLPGVVNFEMDAGAAEPGAIIQAVNRTNGIQAAAGLEGIIEPVADVAEGDGSAEISVVADSGEVVCFRLYDASGNASEEVCYTVSTVDAPSPGLPTQIAFTMAGANPVRGEARFHFALPQAATVDLTLFDVAGRRVATLAQGEYPAGDHVLVWDPDAAAPRVSSGIYFVRFRAPGYSETKRLVLIR